MRLVNAQLGACPEPVEGLREDSGRSEERGGGSLIQTHDAVLRFYWCKDAIGTLNRIIIHSVCVSTLRS